MNKNTVLGYATLIMIIVAIVLICLGAFRYNEIAGWGFASVGIGFLAIAWVFNALKGKCLSGRSGLAKVKDEQCQCFGVFGLRS